MDSSEVGLNRLSPRAAASRVSAIRVLPPEPGTTSFIDPDTSISTRACELWFTLAHWLSRSSSEVSAGIGTSVWVTTETFSSDERFRSDRPSGVRNPASASAS